MQVFGDAQRIECLRAKQDALIASLDAVSRMPPGLDRHSALVAAFIGASECAQGIADASFEAQGQDAPSPGQDGGMRALMRLAQAVDRSWRSGFRDEVDTASSAAALDAVEGPRRITTRQAEGYAFYALYPEAFIEAARRSNLSPNTCVIGIRSIGAGLAALVAAALGAPPPVTVRPVGHPFRRELRIAPVLADAMLAGFADYAIVDEGPGLSGSSFGAVADWLEDRGVARSRIHVFPGHAGDLGPQASEAHRDRWASIRRHCVDIDDLLRGRLENWVADCVGPLRAPLRDVSGGGWRALRYADAGLWPAANLQQERRKFIARTGEGTYLVKFAGLGREGARKFDLARRLGEADFAPPAAGLCHGFMIERWTDEARSLDRVEVGRSTLIDRMGAYLGFRAGPTAGEARGASAEDLVAMARHNTRQALGEAASRRLDLDAGAMERCTRRVLTDGRMLPHEWLLAGDGRILKTDAVDHHAAHDLVGCQDIAWDVAGAAVEFGFCAEETARLAQRVGDAAGRPVDPSLLAALTDCYLAFRLGASTLAAEANGGAEAVRLRAAADAYAGLLARRLERQTLMA